MTPIIIPLSKTIEVSPGVYTDRVTLNYLYTYGEGLELFTSIGSVVAGYPGTEAPIMLTEEDLATPAGEFIKTIIPAKIKAWAEEKDSNA